ncbi:hemolysin family protein [Plantibacter sp. YIM 135249]|uniref:hemolysin family protein n=1 Tax=Plantibacter sp. YIM 135249 TaxID=3423918 RepID=UPI003D35153A
MSFITVAVVAAILLVAFAGLMAAADAAISVQSRADILELADRSRAKKSLQAIAGDPDAHVNAINFTRILAETTAAVLVTLALALAIDIPWLVLVLAALIMTITSFVLVGASPRGVGRTHAKGILQFSAPLIRFVRLLLGPVASLLVALGNRVTPGISRSVSFTSEEQLLSMVDEAAAQSVLEEDDRELIHSIFEFNETVVREVMVPRTDMVSLQLSLSVREALDIFLETGISRAPVTAGDIDDMLGILYLKDLVKAMFDAGEVPPADRAAIDTADAADIDAEPLRALLRPATFVPESKKADSLLQQMQLDANHIAMVVDEYGGISGLVTLEDLIEELVGEISDEYDTDVPDVTDLGDGSFRVDARLPVDELGELFGIELDDDDVDSAGGLLAKTLGRLPVIGSSVTVSGLVLTAERVERGRGRIRTVMARRSEELTDAQNAFTEQQE